MSPGSVTARSASPSASVVPLVILFYWEYLVNEWLVPGPAFFKESTVESPAGNPPSLYDYGWLHERDSLLEQ